MRNSQGKHRTLHGINRIAVNRDQFTLKPTQINPHVGGRRPVDNPQADLRASADTYHFRIHKRPVIGQIGVKLDVIKHAGHGHLHASHRMARMPSAFQFRHNFLWIAKTEIMEHHHMLLVIKKRLGRFAHNQWCGQELLLLQSQMGMHPMGAGTGVHKIIVKEFAGLERRLRQHGNPVLGRRWFKSMPMKQCFFGQFIFDPRLKSLAQHQGKPLPTPAALNAKNLRRATVNVNNARSDPEFARRLCLGKSCPKWCGAQTLQKSPPRQRKFHTNSPKLQPKTGDY